MKGPRCVEWRVSLTGQAQLAAQPDCPSAFNDGDIGTIRRRVQGVGMGAGERRGEEHIAQRRRHRLARTGLVFEVGN